MSASNPDLVLWSQPTSFCNDGSWEKSDFCISLWHLCILANKVLLIHRSHLLILPLIPYLYGAITLNQQATWGQARLENHEQRGHQHGMTPKPQVTESQDLMGTEIWRGVAILLYYTSIHQPTKKRKASFLYTEYTAIYFHIFPVRVVAALDIRIPSWAML